MRWGAVDFSAMVLRPYDNWMRGRRDTTKTAESAAIPMTPRLAGSLAIMTLKMYSLRHSFGTGLAANGVDVRAIQALMRHTHLTTTEQYLAYSPRPELANQIARF